MLRKKFKSNRVLQAQTLVFFMLAFSAIFLLCGLAVDSGVLYLDSARLSRAVDAASLGAVGNFNRDPDPATNRMDVANILRNFAAANYNDLNSVTFDSNHSNTTGTQYPLPVIPGQPQLYGYKYIYFYDDADASGNYTRHVQALITTGAGGQITSAQVNASCPARTFLMGFVGLTNLTVSSSSTATRNPRLIMIVLDRSASMLSIKSATNYGGAYGLADAVLNFMEYFDPSSDYIGIVSFGSNARLEMPLTTNFLVAGTNVLSYSTNNLAKVNNAYEIPGTDPESTNAAYATGQGASAVRRLKFGGNTAADDGMRLGMEQMMNNSSFNDPDVYKYLVLFTDGAFNTVRTLLAAPGYTNVFIAQTNLLVTNSAPYYVLDQVTNYFPLASTNSILPNSILPNSPYADAITNSAYNSANYNNSIWQSSDGSNPYEISSGTPSAPSGFPLGGGFTTNVVSNGYVGMWHDPNDTESTSTKNTYTRSLNVWLAPGSVDYLYDAHGNCVTNYISRVSNSTNTVNMLVPSGGSNVLIVPGYVVDGLICDDMNIYYGDTPNYDGDPASPNSGIGKNFELDYQWSDRKKNGDGGGAAAFLTNASPQRNLMLRNYYNLMSGFYVYKPDDPLSTNTADIDPLIDVGTNSPAVHPERPLNGLGPYYPSAPFFWPFNLVGFFPSVYYTLRSGDPDDSGKTGGTPYDRFISFSTNMLSSQPSWAGELFYEGTSGFDPTDPYGLNNTQVGQSTQMTSATAWTTLMPSFVTASFPGPYSLASAGVNSSTTALVSDSNHYTNSTINGTVLRPATYLGYPIDSAGLTANASNIVLQNGVPQLGLGTIPDTFNKSGGYVIDDVTNPKEPTLNRNAMSWSGRPTHFFDFSRSKWVAIGDPSIWTHNSGGNSTFLMANHQKGVVAAPLGFWKAQEYAYHARALGVTIFTVGYGGAVTDSETKVLAIMANANSWVHPDSVSTTHTPISPVTGQPVGEEFYASTAAELSTNFAYIGQSISAGLTGQ